MWLKSQSFSGYSFGLNSPTPTHPSTANCPIKINRTFLCRTFRTLFVAHISCHTFRTQFSFRTQFVHTSFCCTFSLQHIAIQNQSFQSKISSSKSFLQSSIQILFLSGIRKIYIRFSKNSPVFKNLPTIQIKNSVFCPVFKIKKVRLCPVFKK